MSADDRAAHAKAQRAYAASARGKATAKRRAEQRRRQPMTADGSYLLAKSVPQGNQDVPTGRVPGLSGARVEATCRDE